MKLTIVLLFVLASFSSEAKAQDKRRVVCVGGQKAIPLQSSFGPPIFTVKCGEEITVLGETKDDSSYLVKLKNGKSGYILLSAVYASKQARSRSEDPGRLQRTLQGAAQGAAAGQAISNSRMPESTSAAAPGCPLNPVDPLDRSGVFTGSATGNSKYIDGREVKEYRNGDHLFWVVCN